MSQTENYRRAYETLKDRMRHIGIIRFIAYARDVGDIKNYADHTGVSYVETLELWISCVHRICNDEIKKVDKK